MTTFSIHDLIESLEGLSEPNDTMPFDFEFEEVPFERGAWALRKGAGIFFASWNELLHRRLADVEARSLRSTDYFDISLAAKMAAALSPLIGFHTQFALSPTERYPTSQLQEIVAVILKLNPEIRLFKSSSAFAQVWTIRDRLSFVRNAHPEGEETKESRWASVLIDVLNFVIENPQGNDSSFQKVLTKFNAARRLTERSDALRIIFGDVWNEYRRPYKGAERLLSNVEDAPRFDQNASWEWMKTACDPMRIRHYPGLKRILQKRFWATFRNAVLTEVLRDTSNARWSKNDKINTVRVILSLEN